MLTEKQIRGLIVERFLVACESCNSYHRNHVSGQIRALCAVLTEKPPPSTGDGDFQALFEAAGIPFTMLKGGFIFPNEWLAEHGFVDLDKNRPRFKGVNGDW